MIIFDLACPLEHRFEGWFQSAQDFDSQIARGLVNCPQCASLDVRRIPSALHLTRQKPPAPAEAPPQPAVDLRSGAIGTYKQLTNLLLAACEDVGENFVEEARRMHSLAAPKRSICGHASEEEYEMLREEGIEVLRLPLLKPGDLH
jgi:hypothetical protein